MTPAVSLSFPDSFRGMFHRIEPTCRPLLEDALRKVHGMPVPAELRPFFAHVTTESPQPSYVLLPLIFLAAAEASGGITQKHIDSLPTLLLGMEVIAVIDDTVDRTPMRSGRMSFPRRFGDVSSTPFTGALLMLMAGCSKSCPSEILEPTIQCHLDLFSMWLWERQNTYPDRALFDEWLERRYEETAVVVDLIINGSLALNGRPPLPRAAVQGISRIFQDVDDVVSIAESREEQGENDDLQMGVITRPLLLTLARVPSLADRVELLWQRYRPLYDASLVELERRHTEVAAEARPIRDGIRAEMLEVGVPETVRRMLGDLRTCVRETQAPLQPFMRELALSTIERLRACGRGDLNRLLDQGLADEPDARGSRPRASLGGTAARRSVCVFSSSSDALAPAYFAAASELAASMARRGHRLVFGGGNTGLMGAMARSAQEHGGEVVGVIPEIMQGTPYVYDRADEIVVAKDLRARKAAMEARADAFVVLPGGFGTLNEALEILAAKQMRLHDKPVVLLNAGGFYGPLVALFEHLFRERFASCEHHGDIYHLAGDVADALSYLDGYEPRPFPARWF